MTCDVCGLPDLHNGDGDGIGSCDCPRCECGTATGPEGSQAISGARPVECKLARPAGDDGPTQPCACEPWQTCAQVQTWNRGDPAAIERARQYGTRCTCGHDGHDPQYHLAPCPLKGRPDLGGNT